MFAEATYGYDYVLGYNAGQFWFENISAGTYTFLTEAPPNGTTFVGSSAEWIMERPAVNNNLTDLSDYYFASMRGAYAYQSSSSTWVVFSNVPNTSVTMFVGPDELSSAGAWTFPGSTCMAFNWHAFH
jgi:hypothetical protein